MNSYIRGVPSLTRAHEGGGGARPVLEGAVRTSAHYRNYTQCEPNVNWKQVGVIDGVKLLGLFHAVANKNLTCTATCCELC